MVVGWPGRSVEQGTLLWSTKYLGFDSSAHTQDLELKKLCIRWPQSVWFMDLRGPVRAPRTKPALGFNFVVVID
jgi:hypothetical protein